MAVDVYKITDHGEFKRDFELKDQLRRAVVSIASNIAEGEESGTNKQIV
ncbi:MAG: four helix bundle protein [candidate division KSB1 bacterium]|nr:four helix bundle protein [candidate division KSB1 bacterium]